MRRFALIIVVGFLGCHEDTNNNGNQDLSGVGDDLSGTMTDDAGEDLAVNVGDLALGCGFVGDPCSASAACCAGLSCDPGTNVCVMGMCKAAGETCSSPAECCTMTCTATKCGTSCTAATRPR